MKIIEIPAAIVPRKAFLLDADEQHFLEFKPGIQVLPAQYSEDESGAPLFHFIARHEDGEKCWKGGGYEVRDSNGASRAFHLDSLIVHPKYFKRTGMRGRPKKDLSDLKVAIVYVPTGGKRGRPRKDPDTLQIPKVYIPTGGKRGRPSKNK